MLRLDNVPHTRNEQLGHILRPLKHRGNMVGRRQALKLGMLKITALLTGASAAHSQEHLTQNRTQPLSHVFPSLREMQEARDLRVGDVVQTPQGLYKIIPDRLVSRRSVSQSIFGKADANMQYRVGPTVTQIEASNAMAVLDSSTPVSSVSALENDLRTYQDLLGDGADSGMQVYIVTEEGFRYETTSASARDFDIQTAGRVRLKALPDRLGRITARQFGISGTEDARPKLRKLFAALKNGRAAHILIDADIHLPGTAPGLVLQEEDVPGPSTLEFLPNCRFLFNSDGNIPHNYLRIEGVSKLDLIQPQIINTVAPQVRHILAGIFLKDCDDCSITGAYIENVCGAGVVIENSRHCVVKDSIVVGSLADGFHITNGHTGPSEECWTYNCIARDTGDDGVSIVSYRNGGADPCLRCGHLNFYVSRSAARGSSIVGGDFCRLQGEVWRSNGPGLIVNRDEAFNTYDVRNSDLNVVAHECGARVGAAGIEIGAGCNGITGTLVSSGSTNRGISIASVREPVRNIDVSLNSQNSGGDGIYIDHVDGLNLRSAYVHDCASNGLVVRSSQNVTISHPNIRNYGTATQTNRGLIVQGCELFHIGAGLLVESTGQSEKALRVNDSANGIIEAQQKVGGTARVLVDITTSCQNVFYDGEMLRLHRASFTLECQNFGSRTSTELADRAVTTVSVPEYGVTTLPVGVPARIVNSTVDMVRIVAMGGVLLRGAEEIPAGAIVTVTQIRPDLWHIT